MDSGGLEPDDFDIKGFGGIGGMGGAGGMGGMGSAGGLSNAGLGSVPSSMSLPPSSSTGRPTLKDYLDMMKANKMPIPGKQPEGFNIYLVLLVIL